jgi:hypothetical protein
VRHCRHDIDYSILTLCKEKPTTIAEIYSALGINYPTIRTHVRDMTYRKWIAPVNQDGSPPFGLREDVLKAAKGDLEALKGLKTGVFSIKIGDYPYKNTPFGDAVLRKLNEIQKLDDFLRAITKSNYEGEMVLLKPNRFRKKPRVQKEL